MELFRPVGFKEMDLILNTGCRRFPPRLPSQPIFYPVLNIHYAEEIAEKWNTKDVNSGYVGYVTKFEVEDSYIANFESHTVGGAIHQEFWIPSEELDEFNKHINGNILLSKAYYGKDFVGEPLVNTPLKNKNYFEQFSFLFELKKSNLMDYICEVLAQWKIISQNYFIWEKTDFSVVGIGEADRELLLQSMRKLLIKNWKWFIETIS